jgi:aldose 1-epimerase
MEIFGRLKDGTPIEVLTLGNPAALQARILTYGGILQRLTLPGKAGSQELVLSLPDLDAYVCDRAFMGCVVGRFANRIAGASFELDGTRFRVTANEGANHLHGGRLGFGKRIWSVLDFTPGTPARLRLGLRSPDGEEGYPGSLEVSAEFVVTGERLTLRFEATSDAPTPINLTYHPYFNLGGGFEGEHFLRIPAERYLTVTDRDLIPSGELCPVQGTPFDFRQSTPLHLPAAASHPQLIIASGYDHCFARNTSTDEAAILRSECSGITLRLRSDQPGLQFYGGQALPQQYPQLRHGISLEPQRFPNAPNEESFGCSILRPGEIYSHSLMYQFSGS